MKKLLLGLILGIVFGISLSIFAWVNPSGNPPTGGGVLQTQNTGLFINTSTYFTSGNVGIGTTAPQRAKLVVEDSVVSPINSPWGSGANAHAFSIMAYDPTPPATDKVFYNIQGTVKELGATSVSGYRIGVHGLIVKSDESDWYLGGSLGQQSGPYNQAFAVVGAVKSCPPGYQCFSGFFSGGANNYPFVVETGNVGIGTTAPEGKLHVTGDILRLDSNNIVFKADDTGDIVFQNSDGTQKARIWAGTTAGSNYLFLSSADNIADITINPNGNVGIGTTNPVRKLHLIRDDATDAFYLSGCNVSANSTVVTCTGNIDSVKPGMTLHVFANTYPSGYTPFWRTIVAVDYSNRTITLNEPSPPRNYDSSFSYMVSKGGMLVSFQGSDYNYFTHLLGSAIYLSYNGSLSPINGGISTVNGTLRFFSTKSFHFFLDTDNAYNDSTGQIVFSIVKNNSYFGSPYSEIFRVNESGQVWAPSYTCSSDIRLKENLRMISDVLPALKELNVYKFNWNRTAKEKYSLNGEDIGVIAQEVEKYFPELIHVDQNGYKNIKYDRFSFLLLEAIKEQQKEIEELKAEIQKLKNE